MAAGLRGTAPGDAPDSYLGLLASEEELRLYGFITNTRVKLVVAVDDPVVKDDEMRAVSRQRCPGCLCGLLCPGKRGWNAGSAALGLLLPLAQQGTGPCRADSGGGGRGASWRPSFVMSATCAARKGPAWPGCRKTCVAFNLPPALQIFRRMHAAFADAVSNPFYAQGSPLTSPRFDASIRTIATSLGALT